MQALQHYGLQILFRFSQLATFTIPISNKYVLPASHLEVTERSSELARQQTRISISFFSLFGPAVDGRIKPDISAPGLSVGSASHTADNEYLIASGTSMASPPFAGLAALLLAFKPSLTYLDIVYYLTQGAERNLVFLWWNSEQSALQQYIRSRAN
ncbi:Serine protease AprX [Folsomia candida]|uniref:Serine protease AprX n=2 Tax=Folsomia candida TaxID=158441 RepID=A0A226DR84_FOLCA|nr:Serine protease AprX [Folsomia candida]